MNCDKDMMVFKVTVYAACILQMNLCCHGLSTIEWTQVVKPFIADVQINL